MHSWVVIVSDQRMFVFSARGSKSQEPSAVEELQALMLSVGESSSGAKENLEKVPDGSRICKVEASMEIDVQKDKGSVTVPNLEMVEEPEEVCGVYFSIQYFLQIKLN